MWRIHSAFDVPSERFGHVVLTDEREGEQLDRIPVVRGEIRIADRGPLRAERIANGLADGGPFDKLRSGDPGRLKECALAAAER